MKQKTAIELLSSEILEVLGDSVNSFTDAQTLKMHYAFNQANDKFREQIEEAFNLAQILIDVYLDGNLEFMIKSASDYYQQKYGEEPTIKAVKCDPENTLRVEQIFNPGEKNWFNKSVYDKPEGDEK